MGFSGLACSVMRVVLVHSYSQDSAGGDACVWAEKELLSAAGHPVIEYARHNEEICHYGLESKATLGLRAIWAWDSYREARALLFEAALRALERRE